MIRLLNFAIFLLFASNANSQPFYFRHYQVEHGLSNNAIYCFAQDRDGFIWVGTKGGLNRFDGRYFKTFRIPSKDPTVLSRDLVYSLAIDRAGALWVGSEKGLFRFDSKSETLVPFLDSLTAIHSIHINSKGELWFISKSAIHAYNFKTRRHTAFPPAKYFIATALCETEDGNMWFSSVDGCIYRLDSASDGFTKYPVFSRRSGVLSKRIEKIASDGNGSIYIGTASHGIKKFSPSSLSYRDLITYNEDQTAIHVRDILKVNQQEVWFATESGIFILNLRSGKFQNIKKRFLNPYSLSDNAVYALLKDQEGGIWAGTYFGGINYLPRLPFTFQKLFPDYSKMSLSGNTVREICQDKFGNLWIGTEDGGLNKLNPKTNSIKSFLPNGKPSSISNTNIHALLEIDDELWIGTFEHGLDIMDISTGEVKKHYRRGSSATDLQSDFIISMLRTAQKKHYVGTSNGLFIFNKKTDSFTLEKNVPSGGYITFLMEDSKGGVWAVAQDDGVYYLNPKGGREHFTHKPSEINSLPTHCINSVFEDSSHSLWFSTDGGGLCKLDKDKNRFTRYTVQEGLPGNLVYKVLEDDRKNLWITTSKGLGCMNMKTGTVATFDMSDGLLSDQFNYGSGYKDKNGRLYFGSVRGLISLDPGMLDSSKYTPRLFIIGMEVHHNELKIDRAGALKQSLLYTDEITLPHDQSSLSFDFAAVSFSAPEKTIYRYRLLGLDPAWVSLKSNRKVYFTKLAPGEYTLQAEAAGNLFQGRQQKNLRINILPPVWATRWAYLFYVLISAALIAYIIRLYHKIQENKKAKAIYDAKIEFFTNITHEIRTPLTLIKVPVDNLIEMKAELPQISKDVLTMERNTIRLINLVNQILDFRKAEEKGFSLDFKEVNLTNVLRETFLTFKPSAEKKKLEYTLCLPTRDISLSGDEEALTKILSNLANNAVKYAKGKVAVTLRPPSNKARIVIEVRSDGVLIAKEMREKVFEPFFRMKETVQEKGTGMGLALARSLAELHKGKLYLAPSDDMNIFILDLPAV